MRHLARRDTNHQEIVKAAQAVGASVVDLANIGSGCPDILVGFRGVNYLVEIKDGSKAPSRRRLTPDERAFHKTWEGQVAVCAGVDDLLRVLGL